ncbi:tetratricopeptide repeat protein [Inquilinus sp. Marseille-Q2685]|uniref:tetratricopeptide repeat protein n=1 Tax=Inquilinus sp. Marseille-Q2685 TaxID=2866581 RepID=UPI001CE4B5B0|nr:tetratricopeptide repeat protein [Inquilinus sp. Marseille-Q2685]
MGWLDRLTRARAAAPPSPGIAEQLAAASAAARAGDHAAALAIWGPLARKGVARAQSNVGACFAEGLGVERDLTLAVRWLTLAAEAGDPVGQRNLATLHFRGEGVARDDGRAAALYRAAAEQGDAAAQDMLSWMLVEDGALFDPAEARLWAQRAAGQGVATAMTRLGMLHHNALGVARDPAEAVRWWRMAADRGEPDAQSMLGAAYHLGSGVAADPVLALAWLIRGQAGGSALAGRSLGPARAALDPAGIAEAEALARRPLPEATP